VLGGLRATFLCENACASLLLFIANSSQANNSPQVIIPTRLSWWQLSSTLCSQSIPPTPWSVLQKPYSISSKKEASVKRPIAGNKDGSYLTLKSNFGLVFDVIQLCSGMGIVFLDQGYWQRAIASRPTTAVKTYILGGAAWFAIPSDSQQLWV
jgi:hypothetical protein